MTKTVEKVQKITMTPNEERLIQLKQLYPECLTAGLFSFRFFLCNLSQVLIFCNMQMSRDFSRDICWTSP